MDARETAAEIDAAAADWVARLDRASGDPGAHAAAAGWAAADPRRRGALLRAQAAWEAIAGHDISAVTAPVATRRRFILAATGLAASIAAGGALWLTFAREAAFSTAVGEQRRTLLADGSTMLLNTRSRSHIAISDTARRVTIDEGEAWFQVAKDKTRPFVVSAGAVRVQAVGTAFAVRRLTDRAEIVVTEGQVRVWSTENPARFLMLTAGRRATVADSTGAEAAAVTQGGAGEALAWRRGEIVLDGMTLGDAAAEFNRYNRRQLSVEAPLADRRIVGWFRTDDLDGFARSAAAMTGAKIEQDKESVRIVE